MPDYTNLYAPETAFEEFLQQVRAALGKRLKQIVLFGSRARGDNTPESDYDCLIVVDEVTHAVRDAVFETAGSVLVEQNIVIAAIPISQERFENGTCNPFLINVNREGVVL